MDSKQHASTSKPKNKNKLLKMLPKAMSFGHRVPPFSPGKDHHHHHYNNHNSTAAAGNRAFFSGPIVPLVPNAVRVRRAKNDAVWDEPTSPKVSCIGQIKLVKSKKRSPKKNRASKTTPSSDEKSRLSKIKRLFSFSTASGRNKSTKSHPTAVSAEAEHQVTVVSAAKVPTLGQMKRFASSREALGGFDWAVEMNKEEEESPADHLRGYYSDDDRRRDYLRDEDEEEEDDIIIPFSAPLSLKPKKEVNLWKRRTMDPPKALHLQHT